MPNYFWDEEAYISQAAIDRAIQSLRNQFGSRLVPEKRLTIPEKIKLMWERSSYYKKQEARKPKGPVTFKSLAPQYKGKPYYRVERW